MEYSSPIKKKKILPFATVLETTLPGEHYAKVISQSEKDKYHVWYTNAHMWHQMNKLNLEGKWGQTHRWRAGCQLGRGGSEGVEGLSIKEKDSWTWTIVW